MKAMILAAGLGTRLKPLTDSTPKALIKIKNYTLLELQIKKLHSEGFDEIIINVHHFADKINIYLKQNNYFGCGISVSNESEKLLDTGGGLKKASHFFSDGNPFLVYNVDILSSINLKNLLETHLTSGCIATLAIRNRKSSRKFLFNTENKLCGWMNENSKEKIVLNDENSYLNSFAFSGVQIVNPAIFKYFPDKDVFSLVDLYLSAAKDEKILSYLHNDDFWMDLGKKENIVEAENRIELIRSIYPI
jgi:NDP-sugar pyrophosphorylase family protein